jgi:Domain of unknown function (DUF3883)
VFEPERVLVWNDGVPFAARDVWAICSAGHSAKRNKIGFFGIGFKSVYKMTATPEIYSGPYALRIEDKLYPSPLTARRRTERGAWFVLPVLRDQQAKLRAMIGALVSPEFAQVLLTLTSLQEIRVIDRTGAGLSGRFRRTPVRTGEDSTWDECDIRGSWGWASARLWRRFFHETAPVPEGVSREGRTVEPGDRSVVVLARPTDGQPIDLRVHCFLPTAVASEIRWLVQADFEPSASREQLRSSPWNEWLMREAGVALASAVKISARTLGEAPWDLIPLDDEVRDTHQRLAYEVARSMLRDSPFVSTRKGWRRPPGATWGLYPGIAGVVREGDLPAASGRDVSYVRDDVLGPISAEATSRAEGLLKELGAEAISCADVVALFDTDDAVFGRVRRDGPWWVAALALMARHATDDEREALARTRCLPIRGGARVQPSPAVDHDGYLVAFSRSDLTEDLREYLGESQVFLIETFLSPRSDGRRVRDRAAGEAKTLTDVAEMLESDPFNVAPEAGPYHVIANLVVPRIRALASSEGLSNEEVNRAWRMFEYVRQKWPTYLSEYRRRRNDRATDATIAADLGEKLLVVAASVRARDSTRRLLPINEAYLPSELVGWEAMDVALGGDDQVFVVDAIYGRPLRVTLKRRGGRARSMAHEAVDFLRILGAPVGPRVARKAMTQVRPSDLPWVDWSGLPAGARGRVALGDDWDSADVARLAIRWPGLSAKNRAVRGAALLRCIEADWPRLAITATTYADYFYSTWNWYAIAATSWVGRLRQMPWLPSLAGSLARPTDLVVDTQANRLALGGAPDGVLKWRVGSGEPLTALGVRARPSIDRIVETLGTLRSSEDAVPDEAALAIARACYQVLAEYLRDGGQDDTEARKLVATRMRGGSGRGLIFAPPPEGVDGERWWPPSRVLQNDAMRWVGPYAGQLAGRYRTAGPLWDSLAIRRDLTIDMACEIIARDLASDSDQSRAHEYYGRLMAFIDEARATDTPLAATPCLTTLGWRPAGETWWSNRAEVLDALATSVAWWQPGTRDPSSLRRAAAQLGIREARTARNGGPLGERWEVGNLEPLELEAESRWHLAIRTWPHVLRQDADPARWAAYEALSAKVLTLRPAVTDHLRLRLSFTHDGTTSVGAIEPPAAFRERDAVVLGTTTSALFSTRAADAVASLVEDNQQAASRELALLFSMAAHDTDELERRAARHAVAGYQHREFIFSPADLEDVDLTPQARLKVRSRRKPTSAEGAKEESFVPLADPLRYGLVAVTRQSPSGQVPVPLQGGRLKAPVTDDPVEGESGGNGRENRSPSAKMRYANTEVEGAAQPFIAEYELATYGSTIVRQGPNVGADYLTSDGRYIEVKAFSGSAPDGVEFEATEWKAAQHPEIADRFWLYVVEHVRDGRPPKITAVLNPISDPSTSKEPTGKLRIRGWKNAAVQQVGEFGERVAARTTD